MIIQHTCADPIEPSMTEERVDPEFGIDFYMIIVIIVVIIVNTKNHEE